MIQSFVDLANGIFVMTSSSILMASDTIGSPSCTTVYVATRLGFLVFFYSMTAQAIMSFERYMGVLYPFLHRAEVTKSRLFKCFISVCCLQTILLLGLTAFNEAMIAKAFFSVNLLLFLALTTYVYAKIFCFRIKNNKCHTGRVVNVAQDNAENKARFLKETKIAKSCFLVVISNIVCCLPSIIYYTILNPDLNFHVITVRKWLYVLSMFNSTANSLIFFWRNKELRTEGLNQMKISLNTLFYTQPFERSQYDANS